jgi:predicted nuclease of restriction endonuclease-like (RecB) superfamily
LSTPWEQDYGAQHSKRSKALPNQRSVPLIRHLETFLLKLGDDFTFVGRQRQLRIDEEWFRIDLVFFHRRLRCLVLIGSE